MPASALETHIATFIWIFRAHYAAGGHHACTKAVANGGGTIDFHCWRAACQAAKMGCIFIGRVAAHARGLGNMMRLLCVKLRLPEGITTCSKFKGRLGN